MQEMIYFVKTAKDLTHCFRTFHANAVLWYKRSDVYKHLSPFSQKNLRRQTEERHLFVAFVFPVIAGKIRQNIFGFTYI